MARLAERRSKRLLLRVPVRVYGREKERSAFHEETATLSISAHGGLLDIGARVVLGQTLLVVNRTTWEEQECRVAYIGPSASGKTKIGVAFNKPAPHFWQVDFPRVDRRMEQAPAFPR